jgi:hypothetical protein
MDMMRRHVSALTRLRTTSTAERVSIMVVRGTRERKKIKLFV